MNLARRFNGGPKIQETPESPQGTADLFRSEAHTMPFQDQFEFIIKA